MAFPDIIQPASPPSPLSAPDAKRRPKLLFLVTEDWYFCSHRLPVARAARDASTAVVDSRETPTARVLQEPKTRVSDEGANLLKESRVE